MRIDRYTQKMQEALQAAQDLASQLNNSEITNEHFLSALLDQNDGIARPLLEKVGANVDQLQERLRTELERRPKIHGSAADLRVSNELRSVLDSAEKEMSKLKVEFTSAEHYLLALAGANVPAAKLLKDLGGTAVLFDYAPFKAAAQLLYAGPWVAERTAAVGDFIEKAGSQAEFADAVKRSKDRRSEIDQIIDFNKQSEAQRKASEADLKQKAAEAEAKEGTEGEAGDKGGDAGDKKEAPKQ